MAEVVRRTNQSAQRVFRCLTSLRACRCGLAWSGLPAAIATVRAGLRSLRALRVRRAFLGSWGEMSAARSTRPLRLRSLVDGQSRRVSGQDAPPRFL